MPSVKRMSILGYFSERFPASVVGGLDCSIGQLEQRVPFKKRLHALGLRLVQEQNAVCDVIGKAEFMCHADQRYAAFGQLAHGFQDLAHQFGVQRQVTSSNSITTGSIAKARAIATGCFCPPDSRPTAARPMYRIQYHKAQCGGARGDHRSAPCGFLGYCR